MTWTTAQSDLRTALSDNATDKMRYRKTLIGTVDGVNTVFKTLEFRRTTNFITSSAPLGVYVNGVRLISTDITADFQDIGAVDLKVPPANGDRVEATYYLQWFNDDEINQFLRVASNWCNLGNDFTQIPEGLRPCNLDYAQGEAYQKLALRWSEKLSETFQLEDAIEKDRFAMIDNYAKWGAALKKGAAAARVDFYSRSGQNESPLWGNNVGPIFKVTPNE